MLTQLRRFFTIAPAHRLLRSAAEFVLELELPGVKKENIKIDCSDNSLRITAKKNKDTPEDLKVSENFRDFADLEQSWNLTADINIDKITADYEDGLLTLHLPREAKRQIEIHPR